ncbi:MAG: hypothetical protein LW629_10350 [Burkholderiales bacterium]|jgi:hypothetical protein|nr:hypothetical protein [Burkholderiales bacterium]
MIASPTAAKNRTPDFSQPVALFLDANVLFSDWQRALWLSLAETLPHVGLYDSDVVQDECFRNLIKLERLTVQGAAMAKAHWTQQEAVKNVSAFDAYFPDVRSVHEKDRHVAAAALKLKHSLPGCQIVLLTWNIKDFPNPPLRRLGIHRATPDDCLKALLLQTSVVGQQVLEQATVKARQAFELLGESASVFQSRASGFPSQPEQWPEFLHRNWFKQSAKAFAAALSA